MAQTDSREKCHPENPVSSDGRKSYRPPQVVEYGTVGELTQGGAGLSDDFPGSKFGLFGVEDGPE